MSPWSCHEKLLQGDLRSSSVQSIYACTGHSGLLERSSRFVESSVVLTAAATLKRRRPSTTATIRSTSSAELTLVVKFTAH